LAGDYIRAEYRLALDRKSEFIAPSDSIVASEWNATSPNIYKTALVLANSCTPSNPNNDIVIGTENSPASEDAATIFKFFNLNMLSFGGSSDALSDKNRFPTFGRTVQATSAQGFLLPFVLKYFGWDRIAIIATSDSYGSSALANFQSIANTHPFKINVLSLVTFPSGSRDSATFDSYLQNMKDSGAFILVAIMTNQDFAPVIAAAQRKGMTGGLYQWVGSVGVTSLLPVGSIGLNIFTDRTTTEFNDFETRYKASPLTAFAPWNNCPALSLQGRVYDTTLLVLRTIRRFNQVRITCNNAKVNATYYNPTILAVNQTLAAWCTLDDNSLTLQLTRNITFQGAVNFIHLDENGDVPMGSFVIMNKRVTGNVEVAEIKPDGAIKIINDEKILWSSGQWSDVYTPPDMLGKPERFH